MCFDSHYNSYISIDSNLGHRTDGRTRGSRPCLPGVHIYHGYLDSI